MSKRILSLIFASFILLTGCAKSTVALPPPADLYATIAQTVTLPEMVSLPQDQFPDFYGIETDWFTDAVSYTCLDSLQPDEIVIVKAADKNTADQIQEKLQARLAYKTKVAENYTPDSIPSIQKGVVRQDGLTVSLLVSKDIDAIVKLYDGLK